MERIFEGFLRFTVFDDFADGTKHFLRPPVIAREIPMELTEESKLEVKYLPI